VGDGAEVALVLDRDVADAGQLSARRAAATSPIIGCAARSSAECSSSR
jgi:hypothetical protein